MGKDFSLDDIPKVKKIAIIVGICLGLASMVWSIVSMQKNTTIDITLKVGESINIGSVMVDFDEDGKIEGANESVSCIANVDPVNKNMYQVEITGKSEGKATIKVTAVYDGEYTTYKYKIKVEE